MVELNPSLKIGIGTLASLTYGLRVGTGELAAITYGISSNSFTEAIVADVSRFFTPLLGSGSQRYEVDIPPSFAGNWEWEIKIAGLPQRDTKLITIQDTNFKVFNLGTSNFSPNNTARLYSNTGIGFTGNTVILNNKLNTLILKYVASTERLTLTVNGVIDVDFNSSISNFPDMTSLLKFSVGVEASNNGGGFTGYLADFRVHNEGALVIDAPLDKQYTAEAPAVINKVAGGTGLTAVNLNNAGSEFTASDDYGWVDTFNFINLESLSIGDAWTDNGNNTYTTTQLASNSQIAQGKVIPEGVRMLASYSLDSPVSPSTQRIRSGNDVFLFGGDNLAPTELYTSDGSFSQRVYFEGGAYQLGVTLSKLSFRKVLEIAEVSQ